MISIKLELRKVWRPFRYIFNANHSFQLAHVHLSLEIVFSCAPLCFHLLSFLPGG